MSRTTRSVARVAGTLAILVAALAGCATDNSTVIPAPTTDEAAETSRVLAAATAVQGMCYGWHLQSGSSSSGATVSRGSGLGPSTPVDSDASACREWVEVVANVTYTSASSEISDSATVSVKTNSTRVTNGDLQRRLAEMGFDGGAFLDEPAFVLMHAALALPLVTTEAGAATPLPVTAPSAASSAPVAALPPAGNDFLRNKWGFLVAAGVMVLLGLGAVGFGAWQRGKVTKPVRT
ncbi:hypothetical protein [Catenuloplanes japonicus]|uniref:hypothetical protein n=1 Tax=Catenuloplanes japonicus TaxID=33876 RepID=UPI000691ABD1|nr:hypothetical protein [Catenuloplanes japonicus]